MGALNFYMQERFFHSLIRLLYPSLRCIYLQESSVDSPVHLLFPWVQCQSLKPVLTQCSQTGFVTVDFIALYTAYTSSIPAGAVNFYCKNIFYTRWYDFYTHVCDVFTCKNILYTLPYAFYSHGCNVRAWNMFWASVAKPVLWQLKIWCFIALYTRSYIFYSHGCNKFPHARMFFTLADMIAPFLPC